MCVGRPCELRYSSQREGMRNSVHQVESCLLVITFELPVKAKSSLKSFEILD